MKKKIKAITLALVLTLALTACGGKKQSLNEAIQSDEMKEAVEAMNDSIASTGMTITLAAEENTLIYNYHLPDLEIFNSLSEEDAVEVFSSSVNASRGNADQLFTTFQSDYGIDLDAVRFVFLSAGGTESYSADITK